jgi:hypothetical protein
MYKTDTFRKSYDTPFLNSAPDIDLKEIKKLTTGFGIIHSSHINLLHSETDYKLEDNARAMVAICKHYDLTRDEISLELIRIYFNFIKHCLQPEGYFLNYVDYKGNFTDHNNETNLADANGIAIWALGYMISLKYIIPQELVAEAEIIMHHVFPRINMLHSTRAIAYSIKGLCYYNIGNRSVKNSSLIKALADRLVQMYNRESNNEWKWFESYLSYANAILPEAILWAYSETQDAIYEEVAKNSFRFILSQTFCENSIKIVSSKDWLQKDKKISHYEEESTEVTCIILALSRFYNIYKNEEYLNKIRTAFNWFMENGRNESPEANKNFSNTSVSIINYLLAGLTFEKQFNTNGDQSPLYENLPAPYEINQDYLFSNKHGI